VLALPAFPVFTADAPVPRNNRRLVNVGSTPGAFANFKHQVVRVDAGEHQDGIENDVEGKLGVVGVALFAALDVTKGSFGDLW